MDPINELQQDIKTYQALAREVGVIVSSLKSSVEQIDAFDYRVKSVCRLNDGVDLFSGKTDDLRAEVRSTIRYLERTIMTGINVAISDAQTQVIELEEEEKREE